MIGMVRDWYRTKRAWQKAALQEARTTENLFTAYDELSNRYFDRDLYDLDRQRWSGPASTRRRVGLDKARAEAREFARTNAHARNVLNQIVNFTVGAGFGIRFEQETDARQWREDRRLIKWRRRKREIERRVVRDGEAVLRRFGGELRFVEPADIKTPPDRSENDGVFQGIEVALRDGEPDVETVTAYWVNGKRVNAEEMFMFRDPFSDLNDVRGWPLLYDAQPVMDRYERWVDVRAVLNEARAAITMFRKHKRATPTQLQTFVDNVKSGTFTRPDRKTQKYALKQMPGTVVDHTDDVEYEWKSPNVDARDAQHDGRAMRLLIAAFFSMPEYWVTADASNANLASTLVAENPGIQAMLSWQEDTGGQLGEFLDWWFGRPVEARFVFPNLVLRQPKEETDAYATEHDHGIISRETWRERRRYDHDVEEQRIAAEGAEQ